MKITFRIFMFLYTIIAFSQDAVHNYGAIQIHDTGSVGFHMDVINDGTFNQNLGLVGFYSENNTISLSGTSNPVFYDTEIAVDNGFYVENTMEVANNLNFITGTIFTPRTESETNLSFLSNSFYVGEADNTKIDGYATIQEMASFTFPIGEDDKLRPLTLESTTINDYAKSAYFYENPNNPSTFSQNFDTSITGASIFQTSTKEFWHLESDVPSKVTLTWDSSSEINLLASSLSKLKVVGWNKVLQHWEDLGNTAVSGNFNKGTLTSNTFIPSEYAILTFAGDRKELNSYHYYVSPDGDGINDFLIIDGLDESEENNLSLYNRWGRLVFSKDNYINEFNGLSNSSGSIIRKNEGLPGGVYFYILIFKDSNQKQQGYLHIQTDTEN